MRYGLWALVLGAGVGTLAACQHRASQEHLGSLEPLSQVAEAPAEGDPLGLSAKPVADNRRCHVCHMNYEDEELAVTHAQANVGCMHCHGASDAHCADENNITPPEIMYPAVKINAACMACHSRDKIDILPHKILFKATTAGKKKHCTDCHGDHRLGYRTQHWDKVTGDPIQDAERDEGARQMVETTLEKPILRSTPEE